MIRNIGSIITLTMAISVLLYLSLQSNETIDLNSSDFCKYSTSGLDLYYTVSKDADFKDKLADPNPLDDQEFSPFLGKSVAIVYYITLKVAFFFFVHIYFFLSRITKYFKPVFDKLFV
mgnify:CR=1 FL=1